MKKRTTRKTAAKKTPARRTKTTKKSSVYIPPHKAIILCLSVIAVCLILLVVSTLSNKAETEPGQEVLSSIAERFEPKPQEQEPESPTHGENGTFDVKDGDDPLVMYSITASYINNEGARTYIHDLVGEASVTLENPGGDSVIYVGENGAQPSDINAGLDTISFTTDHFSLYGVVDTMDALSSSAEYAEYGDDNNVTSVVLATILASLPLILGSFVLRRRL